MNNTNEFKTDCIAINNSEINLKVESSVSGSIDGSHSVNLTVIVKDTTEFSSIEISTGDYFEITSFPLDTGITYFPDSNVYQINLSYDDTAITDYYQEIKITLISQNRKYDEFIFLYFENDSLYTWSATDFYSLRRKWIRPHSSETIEFSLGEIDTTPIPVFDTLLPYQYIQVPGKAYSVPVNVDTSGLEEEEYFRRITKTFNGRVVGNIRHLHLNDVRENVIIDIKQVRVEIWENTGGWTNDKLLVSGETNSNGEFDLSYERTKINFDGNIRIYVNIVLKSDNVQVNSFSLDEVFSTRRPNMTHNYTNGDLVTFNVGNIMMEAGEFAQVFHWTARTLEFANSEMNGESGFEMQKLEVVIYGEGSLYLVTENRVYLSLGDVTWEWVVQHEAGHHVHLRLLQKGHRQPLAGGIHTLEHNNPHPNQTITEGFANAIAYITDARYYSDDQEANLEINTNSTVNNHLFHNPLLNTTQALTAEEPFARTLLDLFDDVNKFQGYGFPTGTGNWTAWINDIVGSNINDYANFTYKEILMPFFQHSPSSDESTLQDVGQYFKQLSVNTDCARRKYIKQVLDYSLINPNIATVDRLSTDLISVNQVISHRDDDLFINANGFVEIGTPETYNYTYNAIDRSEINSTTGSFNITNSNNGWGTNISDPLTITDGENLYINNNFKSNWLSGSDANPAQHSHVTMSFCNELTTVEETGSIIIGNWDEHSTATAHLGFNTRMVLEGGSTPAALQINNNSTLIIEAGGILQMQPGARIVLNGPNAVLEIRGSIELLDNADFTVEGGSEGFGYIKINRDWYPNPYAIVGNSANTNKIILEGWGTTDKMLEITGNTGWYVGPDIEEVEISNSLIEIGSGSKISMEMRDLFVLESAIVKLLGTSGIMHNGVQIWAWGASSHIKDVHFEDGIQGLRYYPIHDYSQHDEFWIQRHMKSHIVEGCTFDKVVNGVVSIKVPVHFIDNTFFGYHESGIRTYGVVSSRVYMINNNFSNPNNMVTSDKYGINYWGTASMNLLMFHKNTVEDNKAGLYSFQSNVYAGCNVVENNSLTGFQMEGGSYLSMTSHRFGGFNQVHNPSYLLSRYNGYLEMDYGFNVFDNYPVSPELAIYFYGYLSNLPSVTTLPARANYIGYSSGSHIYYPNSSYNTHINNRYTNSMQEYEFALINPGRMTIESEISSECVKAKWNEITPLSGYGYDFDDLYTDDYISSSSLVITPTFNTGSTIFNILEHLFLAGYDMTTNTPSDVINLYNEVLVDYYDDDSTLLKGYSEIYGMMLNHLSWWTDNGYIEQRINDTLPESAEYSSVLVIFDSLFAQSLSSSYEYHFMRGREFNFNIDRTEVLRLANNNPAAIIILDSLALTVSENFEQFIIDKLTCLNIAEIALREGTTSPDSFFLDHPCLNDTYDEPLEFLEEEEEEEEEMQVVTSVEEIEKETFVMVYPNPANNELFIGLSPNLESGKFLIYGMVGNVLKEGTLSSNSNTINISSLPSGIYIIQIESQGYIVKHKFIIVKE